MSDNTIPPVPYLPLDPNRVTSSDVEKMIETRLNAFWRMQEAEILGVTKQAKRKNLYKTAAIATAGFVVGVGSSMIVSRFRSGRAGAAGTAMASRPLAAVK